MAKKATGKSSGTKAKAGAKARKSTAVRRLSSVRSGSSNGGNEIGDAFIKLLQSPLAAELVAVAATAALAALAEQGFTSRGGDSKSKRAGKAVKEAGKAAAAAVGRRLSNEFDEIRKATKGTSAKA
jgi:hypothetical protein